MKQQYGKGLIKKIALVAVLIIFIIFAFVLFMHSNKERIISQNTEYIGEAIRQTSHTMGIILQSAQENIRIRSDVYGQDFDDDMVDYDYFSKMAEDSFFERIEFVNKDGINMDKGNNLTDISDREYFSLGMKGESGMVPIIDTRFGNGNSILFYTPFRAKDEIIGVLVGIYSSEQIEGILYSTYFGEQADTFLCMKDGKIISASSKNEIPKNIDEYFNEHGNITPENKKMIKENLSEGKSYGFFYENNAGVVSSAYIMPVGNTDLMIFQRFPSNVTTKMINNAVFSGMLLAAGIIIGLVLYVAFLLFYNYQQKKKLIKENREMSYVIDGTAKIFKRFIFADLEENTYKYLAGTHVGAKMPEQGAYSDFVKAFTQLVVYDDDKEKAAEDLRGENLQKNFGRDENHLYYEYYTKRSVKGKERWESFNIICLNRKNAKAVQILLARQDITESKNEELMRNIALKDAFKSAEAANKAKSDFLSRMSHDIRTPMNAIVGMTSIAVMHIDDTAKIMDCLDKITVSSKHLLGLINEVLDMSKIESGKLVLSEEEFSLSEVIDNLITILHPQIKKKNQNFKVNINDIKHEKVIGDSQRLSQVFVNIMGNAVKFTPEGGNISLSIKEKPSKIIGNGYYEFIFKDNGIGMEKKFLDTIFEPFARASDSRVGKTEGTGLGMSIANNIVYMMNGDIQVKSKLGEGSEFTVSVYMRLCEEDNEDLEKLVDLSVLVADDEEYACINACKVLDSIGIKSDYVTDGDSAIKKLIKAREQGEMYTAVILDWKMPGKDGLQTAAEIRRKIGNDIPIIILSAYNWSDIEEEARSIGVNYFISKPLFKSRLIYVMKNIVDKNDRGAEEKVIMEKKYYGKRLLLVEDNELNTEIAKEILEMSGFEVDLAGDGIEAIDKAKNAPEAYYDLILMDIQMPNMNGYEATEKIRELGREDLKNVPIIAMSANTFADDIAHAKNSGMDAHISKPIEISKMIDTIDECLAAREESKEKAAAK